MLEFVSEAFDQPGQVFWNFLVARVFLRFYSLRGRLGIHRAGGPSMTHTSCKGKNDQRILKRTKASEVKKRKVPHTYPTVYGTRFVTGAGPLPHRK